MKWLVTGVAGFIGSQLLETLLHNNETVIGIDNLISGSRENLCLVKKAVGNKWNNFNFFESDITDPKCFEKIDCQIDYVVNLAAIVSVQAGIENPNYLTKVNIVGHLNLLNFISTQKIKKFIFASSSAVYGNSYKKNSETDPVTPISLYGLAKKTNEEMTSLYSKLYSFRACGLRFFNVYGLRQKAENQYSGVISKWIDALLNKKEIFIYGDGEGKRDFINVENVADIIYEAGIYKNGLQFEIYNVATGNNITINKLFNLLNNIYTDISSNTQINPKYCKERKGDIKVSVADVNKLNSNFDKLVFKPIQENLYKIMKDKYEK